MIDYSNVTAAELEKLSPAEREIAYKQFMKKIEHKAVTHKALDIVLRPITDAMVEGFDLLAARIAALEAKEVQNIEAWEASKEYQRRTFVRYDGGVWRCCSPENTRDQPGTSKAWLLAAKGWSE